MRTPVACTGDFYQLVSNCTAGTLTPAAASITRACQKPPDYWPEARSLQHHHAFLRHTCRPQGRASAAAKSGQAHHPNLAQFPPRNSRPLTCLDNKKHPGARVGPRIINFRSKTRLRMGKIYDTPRKATRQTSLGQPGCTTSHSETLGLSAFNKEASKRIRWMFEMIIAMVTRHDARFVTHDSKVWGRGGIGVAYRGPPVRAMPAGPMWGAFQA